MYEEAVLLIYSQLDGMFIDVSDARGEKAFKRLFGKTRTTGEDQDEIRQLRDVVLETESMIATEHEFFLAVREGMSADVRETTLDDHPSRHGVLHGRVLGFGTRRRAAQAFAFLAGCLELLVITAEERLGFTDEELDMPADEMPEGAQFILGAKLASPVRAVYMQNVREGKGLFVTETEPGRRAT